MDLGLPYFEVTLAKDEASGIRQRLLSDKPDHEFV